MVYEEKVLSGYDIQPLQAVGWEGILHFMLLDSLIIQIVCIRSRKIYPTHKHYILF